MWQALGMGPVAITDNPVQIFGALITRLCYKLSKYGTSTFHFLCMLSVFRLYVISQLPKLKALDDTAVKAEERELAAKTYERRRSRRDNNNSKP